MARVLLGRAAYYSKDIVLKSGWFGSDYGGFYVATDMLDKDSVVYSFGIGEDISFDLGVIAGFGVSVYAYDPTPKSSEWIKNEGVNEGKFRFHEIGLGVKSGDVRLYLPVNQDHVSGSILQQSVVGDDYVIVNIQSLSDIMSDNGHTHIDLLKMDIEGMEYDVLSDVVGSGIAIKQIAVEFHDRLFDDGFDRGRKVIDHMKQNGYLLFGVSCSGQELSFIDSKYVKHYR